MTTVAGDPGACSSTAARLAGLARDLDRTGARASAAPVDDAWTGRSAREAAGRHRTLISAAARASVLVGQVGLLLQDHATDLTAAHQDVRRIEERAAAAGLTVVDGQVQPAYGISGLADAGPAHDLVEAAERLQRELDLGLTQLERRRARLQQALTEAKAALASVGDTLRRA